MALPEEGSLESGIVPRPVNFELPSGFTSHSRTGKPRRLREQGEHRVGGGAEADRQQVVAAGRRGSQTRSGRHSGIVNHQAFELFAEDAHGLFEGRERNHLRLAQPAVFPAQPVEPELVGLHAELRAVEQIETRGIPIDDALQRRQRMHRIPHFRGLFRLAQVQTLKVADVEHVHGLRRGRAGCPDRPSQQPEGTGPGPGPIF